MVFSSRCSSHERWHSFSSVMISYPRVESRVYEDRSELKWDENKAALVENDTGIIESDGKLFKLKSEVFELRDEDLSDFFNTLIEKE